VSERRHRTILRTLLPKGRPCVCPCFSTKVGERVHQATPPPFQGVKHEGRRLLIKTAQAAGDDDIKEWLRQSAAWWEEMKGKLIGVKTGESVTVTNHWIGKTTVEVEVPMEAATLRELLHKRNAKVWL
jgi:hypothetical protein